MIKGGPLPRGEGVRKCGFEVSDSFSVFGANGLCSCNRPLPSIIQEPTKEVPFPGPCSVTSCHFSHSPGSQCKGQHLNWVREGGKLGRWDSDNCQVINQPIIESSYLKWRLACARVSVTAPMTAVTHLLSSAGLSSAQLLQSESNIGKRWQLLLPATSKWRSQDASELLPVCCTAGWRLPSLWPQPTRYGLPDTHNNGPETPAENPSAYFLSVLRRRNYSLCEALFSTKK